MASAPVTCIVYICAICICPPSYSQNREVVYRICLNRSSGARQLFSIPWQLLQDQPLAQSLEVPFLRVSWVGDGPR